LIKNACISYEWKSDSEFELIQNFITLTILILIALFILDLKK